MTPEAINAVKTRARQLYSPKEVEQALNEMADAITAELEDCNPLLVCVMNGGLITAGDIAKRLDFPLQLDYLHATRYRNGTQGNNLQWTAYPSHDLKGRVVLVIDDILDEGITLEAIIAYCQGQGAAKVYSAVLVNKTPAQKLSSVRADFSGLEVGDEYVFGYGMDYRGYLRNAAGIFAVAPEDC